MINIDTIETQLVEYIRNPERVKNIIKTGIFLGLKFPDGTKIENSFWENENMFENMKQYILSYSNFIDRLEEEPTLKPTYEATAEIIETAKVFGGEAVSRDYVCALCFDKAMRNVSGDTEEILINKNKLKMYEDYMKAIALGHAELTLQTSLGATTPGVDGVDALYNLMINEPQFSDIPTGSKAYRALALCYYFVKNYKATVFSAHYDRDFLLANWTFYTFRTKDTVINSAIVCMYPASTSEYTKLVYNENTKEWEEWQEGSTATYQVQVSKYDPDGNKIKKIKFTYPETQYQTPNATMTAYDAADNIVTVAGQKNFNIDDAKVIKPARITQEELEVNGLQKEYYKNWNNEIYTDNTYVSTGAFSTNNTFKNAFIYKDLVEIINKDGLVTEWYVDNGEFAEPQPVETKVKMEIIEEFKTFYENGGLYLIDYENGDNVTIIMPDDPTTEGVMNGIINVGDIMDANGNYITDKDGNVVTPPGGTGGGTPNPPSGGGVDDTLGKYTIPNGLFTVYACHSSIIKQLGNQLYDPDIFDILKRFMSDPMQSIISLGFIPYIPDKVVNTNLKIGSYDTGLTAGRLFNQYLIVNHDSIFVPDYPDDGFAKYEPYAAYKIYIPFSGWYDLPSGAVVGHTIHCQSRVDVITGEMVTYVRSSIGQGGSAQKYIVGEYSGNCMRQCPISQSSGNALLNATMIAAGTLATGVAAVASPVASVAVGTIAGQMMPSSIAPSVTTNGSISANAGFMGSSRAPYIIGRYKDFGNRESVYHQIGRYMSMISINGYVEVSGLRFRDQNGQITKQEMDELESLMNSGVIL